MTWQTSIGANGKAHLYGEDGKTACSARKGIYPDGTTLGDLFTRPTRPVKDDDHLCFYCAKNDPRTCLCWSCQAKRRGLNR